MTNVMAKFMWLIARVDSRQYRQNSTELQPEDFWIGVEIPMTSEYVWNAEEILTSPFTGDSAPKPIYTPKALQFCLDKLGEYLRDPEPNDFKQESPDAEDWGDDTPSETAKKDDWSEGASFDKDEQEKEVEELWNEDKENWNE